MNVIEAINNINAGGFVAILVLIGGLIEIAPIKVSPLQWIGRRLNKETLHKVDAIKRDLEEHVAQSNRTKIFNFQDDILEGKPKTRENWKEVINAIAYYEVFCEDNHINNGLCKDASAFLRDEYRARLKTNDFK